MKRFAGVLAVVLSAAALAGCSASSQPAADGASQTPEYHSIPTTSNRAPDPSLSPQPNDSAVSAQDAPLSQLWALVDSGLRSNGGYADASRPAGTTPQDVADFASAIAARCTPQLTAEQSAHLDALWDDVTAAAASAGTDLTPTVTAYVDQATALCM
ncbi:hypothetical protein [Leifsonia aquatica]|nr:hypothetical protein [Leifsonia aquatica]MBB2967626.1 hypothetical protein [Leifsonia aquatica]